MTVSTSEESERRIAEALRARATGAGRPIPLAGYSSAGRLDAPAGPAAAPAESPGALGELRAALAASRMVLLYALLGGVLLGVVLALVSVLAPGSFPPIG